MNQVTTQFIANVPVRSARRASASLLAERVRDFACTLGGSSAGREANRGADCGADLETGRDLWVRAAGRHIILGRGEDEAFARITPLGEEAYGLAFRAPSSVYGASADTDATSPSRWAPLLLIDALAEVVEHALVGESAMDQPALCM